MNLTTITSTSKTQLAVNGQLYIDQLFKEGGVLEAVEQAAAAEEWLKFRKDPRFVAAIRDELAKYPKGKLTTSAGTQLEVAETGVEYHYTNCNDPELARLELAAKEATDAVKKRQEFLKALPVTGLVVTDQDTGEVTTLYPPYKTSTSSYKITLKK